MQAIELVSEAVRNGARKHMACKLLSIDIRSIQRWENNNIIDKRKYSTSPKSNALSLQEKEEIISICCSKRFMNMSPYCIVPILAEDGVYIASESSYYRVLRKAGLLKHRKNTRVRRESEKIELKATGSNQIWSWDISYLRTEIKGKFYYLYMFMDIWSRLITGWEVHENECGNKAAALMQKASKKNKVKDEVLLLHSDNGAPMKSATMLATLQTLGVTPSYSRPSVSNDNAFSESLFKTLKYTAGYPKSFSSLEEANEWVENFVKWYNTEHRHSKIGYVTPHQRHYGEDINILKVREETYKLAKEKNPGRWTRNTKIYERKEEVYLKKGNYKNVS